MDSKRGSNMAGSSDRIKADRASKRILFGIAAAVVLSLAAIAAGLVINDDGTAPRASEVFASWIDFFTWEDGSPESFAETRTTVRSSWLVYEPEDGSYVILKHFSEDGEIYESDGLDCIYTDETGEHTERLVDGEITEFSVMDGVLYYTAWDEEAVGWTLYQRALSKGAKVEECLSGTDRGRVSFDFSCYRGKIYYVNMDAEAEGFGLFCYSPKLRVSKRVSGVGVDSYIYDIWEDTFYGVDPWEGTLWKKEPGERAPRRVRLPGAGSELWQIRIFPYQDRVYLAAIEGTHESGMMVNPKLYVYALDGGLSEPAAVLNLWPADLREKWQYRDGCFYFPSTDAYSIHVFELEQYLTDETREEEASANENESGEAPADEGESGGASDDGSGSQPDLRKLFVSDAKIETIEVTERFLYAYLYDGRSLIRVYDRRSGELVREIGGGTKQTQTETAGEVRHAVHLALPWGNAGGVPERDALEEDAPEDDLREVVFFRRYGNDMRDQFGFGDSMDLAGTFRGGDEEFTVPLVSGNIRRFLTVGNLLFYTAVQDEGTRDTALFCMDLTKPQESECLIDGGVTADFVFYHDSIWYVNRNDGSRLYRFELETGRKIRISDVEVGCYDLWDDTVYYENVSDRTLCKMHLDGTGNEAIEVPHHEESGVWLFQLTVCPYRGNVYLACTTGLGNSLLLFTEDGSVECWLTEELGEEINQGFYYEDGRLYYSTGLIRVFDFEQYFHGSDSGAAGIDGDYDMVFPIEECSGHEGYCEVFEVTGEYVFVKMSPYPSVISVYERTTGRFLDEINCCADEAAAAQNEAY